MVAVIKTGHNIHRSFNYNENKVKAGVAEIIGGENYPYDPEKMTVAMRLNRLLKQIELRPNVKVNSVHISLNFHPSETSLDKEKLMEIAGTYMQKLGFGQQPFLVYQHHDSGHPHLHLVTTNITSTGGRIDMHHLAQRSSEPARKAVEEMFGLVAAEGRKNAQNYKVEPIAMGKVNYGRLETKKAINNVLNGVLNSYRYTSLPELNAVLRQYHVLADRGSENSRTFKANGLVYRILDAQGKPVGVPIKASDFYSKPTLKFLEQKYAPNEAKRMPFKGRVKNTVDLALVGGKTTIEELLLALEKQGIHAALRKSDTGFIYGITYVDHQTKCVFNGSALGKPYSAKAIQERCFNPKMAEQHSSLHAAPKDIGLQPPPYSPVAETKAGQHDQQQQLQTPDLSKLMNVLLQPEHGADYLPNPLKGKKKRKKRRNLDN